ncbi:serine protease [Paenibacillus zeisoli]|uniref:Serine protease n=1 Tax=Paenibacillus zeisoli TaxID=2496267 RepID=A0A433XNG5_9BACL|nr:CAP domain-containing protein [Paenibacillus zeisoli]RUT35620.1 serine protease [Paenibacillus zeisoli]
MRFRKTLITSALALSMVVGTGAASASANTTTDSYKVWTYSTNQNFTNQNFSWENFLQQFGYLNRQGSAQARQGTGNQTQTNTKTNTQTTQTNTTQDNTKSAQTNTNTTQNNTNTDQVSNSKAAYADQVVALVNQERAKAGVKPLAADKALAAMTLDKAKDMYSKGYFDHNSPTYGSPFDMMSAYGIHYTYAGENIAKGQQNPAEVMKAWMNSPGHKQNILSPNYTKIGVAYYNGEWVQEFIAN